MAAADETAVDETEAGEAGTAGAAGGRDGSAGARKRRRGEGEGEDDGAEGADGAVAARLRGKARGGRATSQGGRGRGMAAPIFTVQNMLGESNSTTSEGANECTFEEWQDPVSRD